MTAFGFTVQHLDQAARFFIDVLGATEIGRRSAEGAELAALTGVDGIKGEAVILGLGDERVVLTEYQPHGRAYPDDAVSNDLDFQHLALVVRDMDAVYRRVVDAGAAAVSNGGPQRIPDSNAAAAGIRAFYFRDFEGHPLELIWFPAGKGAARWHATSGPLVLGIDHSAIAVSSTEQSLAFYRDQLGLAVAGRSFNEGIEQERLSGVDGARVRITGLRGAEGPGVEFLEYVAPGVARRRPGKSSVRDLFYWETTIAVDDLARLQARLEHAGVPIVSRRRAACELCLEQKPAFIALDPDGHAVRLVAR